MTGYYRYPALSRDHLTFVSEDSLWISAREGGKAHRLTTGSEHVGAPFFSPDGSQVIFTTEAEGSPQIAVVPIDGGVPRQITWEAAGCALVGVRPSGSPVFRSLREAHLRSHTLLYEVPLAGGVPSRLPVGRAISVSFASDDDRVALGLNNIDSARWKRYRGGMAGDLWVGSLKAGSFRRLIEHAGNPVQPTICGERVYFISDSDGHGNLWSVGFDGSDLRQHTHYRDYYARNLRCWGTELVFQKGAELWHLDTRSGEDKKLSVTTQPSGVQLSRRFVPVEDNFQEFDFAPDGKEIACTVRGKAFVMAPWGGAVRQLGRASGVHYRSPAWLAIKEEGPRQLVLISDEGGEEGLEVYDAVTRERLVRVELEGVGRVLGLWPSPVGRRVLLSDMRGQLFLLDLNGLDQDASDQRGGKPGSERIAHSPRGAIDDIDWSPDGRCLAYVLPFHWLVPGGSLVLRDVQSGSERTLNDDDTPTHGPAFDPKGRFLYALSERSFHPMMDMVQFGAACARETKLYAWVLSADELSPFDPLWAQRQEDEDKDGEEKAKKGSKKGSKKNEDKDETDPKPVKIDLEGLEQRVVEFPDIEAGVYTDLQASGNTVLFLSHGLTDLLQQESWGEADEEALPDLCAFDLLTAKETTIESVVVDFQVRGEKTVIRTKSGLRLLKTGEEPPEEPAKEGKNRHTGWIDLERIRCEVVPGVEWRQMFTEAWRLQREFFWTESMAGIDWPKVRDHYLPLLDRVSTRAELSDLIWEFQGELGTSHAYEVGGDYPEQKSYPVGLLGADLAWDGEAWCIERILEGDPWSKRAASPLAAPGTGLGSGDRILAIDGRQLDQATPPAAVLVHRAGERVELEVVGAGGKQPRRVVIETLKSEMDLRYRDWVRKNRRYVLERSDARLGYMHIPDMSGQGLSEFYRSFRTESKRQGLLVDVRCNGGGFVSQLVINSLRQKVIGYGRPRYGRFESYPVDAVAGPMVALCDQFAGSDGDMFCEAFKAYSLGPLIGKRTWGGVIGIDPNRYLADGTIVTQPEHAFYFEGSGWGVENHGVEPDYEVDLDPASMVAGRDPQLDAAIDKALELLEHNPVSEPDWDEVPSRKVDLQR